MAEVLDGFVGDFGSTRVIEVSDGIAFGLWKPESGLPMTTWSFFHDDDQVAFVEGVFYDDFGSHRIVSGEDPGLARSVAEAIASEGPSAVARLNGSFVGFRFDRKTRSLSTFVDRLGTRSLYSSPRGDGVVLASNLAAFRRSIAPRLDVQSAFQFLTVGFPLGERTLLEGVFLQPPASCDVFVGGERKRGLYWNPKRAERMPLPEAVDRIARSMEQSVARLGRRSGSPLGLGFTGGHDSRVIFGSLLYASVSFETVSWKDNNFNDGVAAELCARAKKDFHFTASFSQEDLFEVQRRAFVYSDGQFLHSYGFSLLGRQCAAEGLDPLVVGYSGDIVSGSSPVPSHLHVRSLADLARGTLEKQMQLLSFSDARALLRDAPANVEAEGMSLWMRSFESEAWRGALPDVSIWQGLQNRNVKRVRMSMDPASQYVPIVYPYLDSAVLDTYFGLPLRFLDQKAHCYASFHSFPEFGDLPASGFSISIRGEARFPFGIYVLRSITDPVRAVKANLRRGRIAPPGVASIRSPTTRSSALRSSTAAAWMTSSTKRRLKPVDLRKMQTLARFHRFYVEGDDSVVPRAYLTR